MSPYNRPRRAHRGSRGIALHILDLGATWGGWSAPRPGRFTPGKYPVPVVQEAGWDPGPVWTCAKNLAPTGIRSPDRPVRSQSIIDSVIINLVFMRKSFQVCRVVNSVSAVLWNVTVCSFMDSFLCFGGMILKRTKCVRARGQIWNFAIDRN
jgi:hypothetical protein